MNNHYLRNRFVREIVRQRFDEKSIDVILNANIVGIDSRGTLVENSKSVVDEQCANAEGSSCLVAEDGRKFSFDEAIWCTQVHL